MLKLNISDLITLHEGMYLEKKIYYIVKYDKLYTPEVYIYDRYQLNTLLRNRNNISLSEYKTYFSITYITKTKFTDSNFEPTYKTKARKIEYKY